MKESPASRLAGIFKMRREGDDVCVTTSYCIFIYSQAGEWNTLWRLCFIFLIFNFFFFNNKILYFRADFEKRACIPMFSEPFLFTHT